jgi:type IV pilus assembly protein PilB
MVASGSIPTLQRKPLGELLVEHDLVSQSDVDRALALDSPLPLGARLVAMRVCTEEVVTKLLSIQLGLPSVRLQDVMVPRRFRRLVPARIAEEFRVLPLGVARDRRGESLLLAMAGPLNSEALKAVRFSSGRRVVPLLAGDRDITEAIARVYGTSEIELEIPPGLAPEEPEDALNPEALLRGVLGLDA